MALYAKCLKKDTTKKKRIKKINAAENLKNLINSLKF
jgi:hypothetical protein